MHSLIIYSLYCLSIPSFSLAFITPHHHHKPIHPTPPQPSSLSSLVSDSSDYKADKTDYGDDDANSEEASYGRNNDDMAHVPTVEEIPVPMSRNNVGSRWIAVVFDRELYKGYNGEIWEGESAVPVVPVGEFDDDDEEDDDDEDLDEMYEEETVADPEDYPNVEVPIFKDVEPKKRTAFDFQPLQILEKLDQDDTGFDEYQSDNILWKMHYDRIALTEEHVMWARKQNLYNETFNTESMADILWSYQILSSDLQRAIGHVMCIDSPTLEHCREALSRDPIIRKLVGVHPKTGVCNIASVPLYRWRHIRDHTLRRDDGRDGFPNMLLAFDHPEATAEGVREANYNKHLEYLIRSERIIAAGPLHVATEEKADPKSVAVGTLMLFNAKDRDHAVEFVENDPFALEGLYDTMTVSRYNQLDVTGKFVSGNLWYPDEETSQMKDAMEVWGYPVDDEQTKWINW